MTRIYLVRHAQPESGGEVDRIRHLTEAGLKDARQVLAVLKSEEIDAIYSSPYERTIATLRPTAKFFELDIQLEDRFSERQYGPKGHTQRMFKERWKNLNFHEEEGESIRSVQKRNIEALREIITANVNKGIVIGTHITALSSILSYVDSSFGYEDFMRIIDWMPYIVELDFTRFCCIRKKDHFYIENNFEL